MTETTHSAVHPNRYWRIVRVVTGSKEPEIQVFMCIDVCIPRSRIHAGGGFCRTMSRDVGNNIRKRILPQMPVFSTYLKPPGLMRVWPTLNCLAWSSAAGASLRRRWLRVTSRLPRTAAGSSVMTAVKEERSISGQGKPVAVGKHTPPLFLYGSREMGVRDPKEPRSRRLYVTAGSGTKEGNADGIHHWAILTDTLPARRTEY